jgi:dTDP-4-dehydrorhamnose reductase
MKVLILGKGYIGTALYNFLVPNNINTTIVSKSDIDYSNPLDFSYYLLDNKPTVVINCSGFTGVPNIDQAEELKSDCWNLNVVGPVSVSNVCKQHKIKHINISSGCIYTGYDKQFTEDDEPNFGIFSASSFYSKTKHAFQTLADGMVIRIRMPFCSVTNKKSYLTKIIKYNNLINFKNSKTSIQDLQEFILYFLKKDIHPSTVGVLNFVNKDPLDTKQVVKILKQNDLINKDWKFVNESKLNTAAPRSNCVLSLAKIETLFPDFKLRTETDAIISALKN